MNSGVVDSKVTETSKGQTQTIPRHIPKNGNDVDFYGPTNLPLYPTRTIPGTEAKMQVLSERFDRQETLNHPLDLIITPEVISQEIVVEARILKKKKPSYHKDDLFKEATNIVSMRILDKERIEQGVE